jgi:hypothetical protein
LLGTALDLPLKILPEAPLRREQPGIGPLTGEPKHPDGGDGERQHGRQSRDSGGPPSLVLQQVGTGDHDVLLGPLELSDDSVDVLHQRLPGTWSGWREDA